MCFQWHGYDPGCVIDSQLEEGEVSWLGGRQWGKGGVPVENMLSEVIVIWLNEEHPFNTHKPDLVNQEKMSI